MRQLVRLVILVFVSSGSVYSQGTIWTLQECINQSYKSNIQINQKVLDNELNKVNIAHTKSNLVLKIIANGDQNKCFCKQIMNKCFVFLNSVCKKTTIIQVFDKKTFYIV